MSSVIAIHSPTVRGCPCPAPHLRLPIKYYRVKRIQLDSMLRRVIRLTSRVHATVTHDNTQLEAGCVHEHDHYLVQPYPLAPANHHAPPYKWVLLADFRLRSMELRSPPRDTLYRHTPAPVQHRPQYNAEHGGVGYITSARVQALSSCKLVPQFARSNAAWLVLVNTSSASRSTGNDCQLPSGFVH